MIRGGRQKAHGDLRIPRHKKKKEERGKVAGSYRATRVAGQPLSRAFGLAALDG